MFYVQSFNRSIVHKLTIKVHSCFIILKSSESIGKFLPTVSLTRMNKIDEAMTFICICVCLLHHLLYFRRSLLGKRPILFDLHCFIVNRRCHPTATTPAVAPRTALRRRRRRLEGSNHRMDHTRLVVVSV